MRWIPPILLLEIYADLMSPVVTENKRKHENIERQIGFYKLII